MIKRGYTSANSVETDVTERFMRYVGFDTQSDDSSGSQPSTVGQFRLAETLAGELRGMGLTEVSLSGGGYVMATLPASSGLTEVPTVGFIAHLDTSPDMSGRDVRPRIVDYMGGDIVLNETMGTMLSPSAFPELGRYAGQQLIVTDGTTLLGADDKAGIAAIMAAMQYFTDHPEVEHGRVRVGFTPDEEIGRGAEGFDVAAFGCEWAYTVDGGELGEIEYENFNAATAEVHIRGLNVHPGYARGKMVNASQLAMELNSLLPAAQRPEYTTGYEGYFHLTDVKGTVEKATLTYLIRDHDRRMFEEKKALLRSVVGELSRKYSGGSVEVMIQDQYRNMREVIEGRMDIVDIAIEAIEATGVMPCIRPVRGGTDGARLSFAGLPCPNLFSGGLNFHSRYEYLPVQSLKKSMETIIELIKTIKIKYR
ncbi:MAG: peptidase T [Tannerella sp.]|nr:peptidase T [Tannerella sp.]